MRRFNSPALITLARVGVLALGLIASPILARSLGPADRGTYGAMVALLGVAPVVLGLGLPMAIRRRASDPLENIHEAFRLINVFIPVMGCVAFSAGMAGGVILFADESREIRLLFAAAAGMASLFVYTLCVQSVMIARERYFAIAVLQFLQGGITAVAIILLWLTDAVNVGILLSIYVVATLVGAIVSAKLFSASPRGAIAKVRPLVTESSQFFATQVAETASAAMPVILVFSILNDSAAGLFSVAVTISSIPLALAYAIGAVVFKAAVIAHKEDRAPIVSSALKAGFISSTFAAIVICAAIPIAVPLVFGDAYAGSVVPALFCTVSAVFAVIGYISMQLLAAFKRPLAMTIAQFVGLISTIAMIVVLSLSVGLVGAGAGLAIGTCATMCAALAALRPGLDLIRISRDDFMRTFRLFKSGSF